LAKPNEDKLPKSELQAEITFRSGSLEITARGSISELSKNISSLSKLAKLAQTELLRSSETIPEVRASEEEIEQTPPVIKADKSTIVNLQSLFDTTWGKLPKTLDQITNALEYNAVPDAAGSIGRDLGRLVKRGVLRRIKRDGKWAYFRIPSQA